MKKARVLSSRKAKKQIKQIFIHPDDIFSIYFEDEKKDVVWMHGKIELNNYFSAV